ncbi:MAG: hypothetical protein NVSMB12_11990 [Acidimicrobiales bacterium]
MRDATALTAGRTDVPLGLPSLPARPPLSRARWAQPGATVAVATAPLWLLLISLVIGGGPGNQSADDAVIGMAARDATHRLVSAGPYSRYGWHHPGPAYLYILGIPTRLWGGTPTGTWIGATILCLVAAGCAVLALRRWGGERAGWWGAVGILLVTCGIGPGLWRDPWNPYAVGFPVLFALVAAALAASGARGALVWAAAAGSLAVQTHVSTLPVVGVPLAIAAVAQLARRSRERQAASSTVHIPRGLPALTIRPTSAVWWRQRPDLAVGGAVLALEWFLPLWDELFGRHNLSSIVSFFLAGHHGHRLGESWRITVALIGVSLGQHHAGIRDGVNDPHPFRTVVLFVGLAAVAIGSGIYRDRPMAAWLGGFGLLALALSVVSVTRIIGPPYKYLLVWVTVLPALPIAGAALGLEGALGGWPARGHSGPILATVGLPGGERAERVAAWLARPGVAVTVIAVGFASLLGLRGVIRARPAAALTDPDITRATVAAAPVVARVRGPGLIQINDGERWPTAAGVGLQLERGGHRMHADPQWAFLFGGRRRATGHEEAVLVVSGADPAAWPTPRQATMLGVAGRAHIFARRTGPACWWGWVPFGGPACPVPVAPPTLGPPPVFVHH